MIATLVLKIRTEMAGKLDPDEDEELERMLRFIECPERDTAWLTHIAQQRIGAVKDIASEMVASHRRMN